MDTNITTTKLRYDRASPETWKPSEDWKTPDCEYMEQYHPRPSRYGDESPMLSYRYEKYRHYAPCTSPRRHSEDRERRSMGRLLAKLFMFCTAMILFCVFMYIPVYSKVNKQFTRGVVSGWSYHTNRDTRVYIKPENITTVHKPNEICPKTRDKPLFLLVVVISSTRNFDARQSIRKTWGDYQNYVKLSKSFHRIREKYKSYNFSYDLYTSSKEVQNRTLETIKVLGKAEKEKNFNNRKKRSISGLNQLLPSIAEALRDNIGKDHADKDIADKTETVEENRFDEEEVDDKMLPEFDMNKELGDNRNEVLDYDDGTSIMKIPPRGYEDSPDAMEVLSLLRKAVLVSAAVDNNKLVEDNNDDEKVVEEELQVQPNFKVVFLLGLPEAKNETDLQSRIDEEADKYGDIIQEDIIDTYNNLTLKSIMMLKWVINECNGTVRYILKTDDDMFINLPNLMQTLNNKSSEFSRTKKQNDSREYLLIGDLINGAKPVLDVKNKWYSPRYMYAGRVYPKYLSGTGYVFSLDAGRALYEAALHTPYFHLEDIFITGMCAARASPRLWPRDAAGFSYLSRLSSACALYAQVTAHDPLPSAIGDLLRMRDGTPRAMASLDVCERMRLTQLRKNRIKSKTLSKKVPLRRHIILRSHI